MTSFSIIRTGAVVTALALSLALLSFANASARDVQHDALVPALLSISFVAMMLVLTLSSLSDRLHFGLQMLAIYFAIYLILPGYHHATKNTFPFYDMEYNGWVLRESALIVTLFLVPTILAYIVGHVRRPSLERARYNKENFRIRTNLILAVTLFVAAVAGAIAYLASVGLAGAFATRAEAVSIEGSASAAGLLRSLPRVVTFISFLYSLVLVRFGTQRLVGALFVGLNLPIFLIVNWPLGLARFVLFGYVLMVMILTLNMRSVMARLSISFGFVVGALGLMPLLNELTRGKGSVGSLSYEGLLTAYFTSGDFDGLQSINNAVVYVDSVGLENGRQLLSALFFFVPRAIWGGKGEPTGTITAEAAGFEFLNISQPLPSEFYVDFGMVGVIAGGALLGFWLCRADQWIDRNWDAGPAARLMGGLLVAYSIILYRGALLGVVSTIATLVAGGILIVRYGLVPYRDARRGQSTGARVQATPVPVH